MAEASIAHVHVDMGSQHVHKQLVALRKPAQRAFEQ